MVETGSDMQVQPSEWSESSGKSVAGTSLEIPIRMGNPHSNDLARYLAIEELQGKVQVLVCKYTATARRSRCAIRAFFSCAQLPAVNGCKVTSGAWLPVLFTLYV